MIAYTTLAALTFLREQEIERDWKMAALAAQLPRTSHRGYRDYLARGLRALASHLDPDPTASAERPASAAL